MTLSTAHVKWCFRSQGTPPVLLFAIILWGEVSPACTGALPCTVVTFSDVLRTGRASRAGWAQALIRPSDLATLVFTSGTTGQPKVLSSFENEGIGCRAHCFAPCMT